MANPTTREAVRLAAEALGPLLRLQGLRACSPSDTRGLHPLMLPLAEAAGRPVLGLVRWPFTSVPVLAEMRRGSHTLRPCGTPTQYAKRVAVEADSAGASSAAEVMAAAASATTMLDGSAPYEKDALRASKLRLEQFLLLRVGPFQDMWEELAQHQLRSGQQTAALVAAERASALNAGWGCGAWLQSQLMQQLGRAEERRDLALASLEAPFWTLGAPFAQVQEAAELSHVIDVRALIREIEARSRQRQRLPPPSESEVAAMRALDMLDECVRKEQPWESVSADLSIAFGQAGLTEQAELARS